VLLLLAEGANVRIRNKYGTYPLHCAASMGHLGCLSALLAAGADKDGRSDDGIMPLDTAAGEGHTACVRTLIAHGAGTDTKSFDGDTPLLMAAWGGHLDCLQLLADTGADINTRNDDEDSPLHVAAMEAHADCLRVLLERGAFKDSQNKDGETPLLIASWDGTLPCVSVLLEHGADTAPAGEPRGQVAFTRGGTLRTCGLCRCAAGRGRGRFSFRQGAATHARPSQPPAVSPVAFSSIAPFLHSPPSPLLSLHTARHQPPIRQTVLYGGQIIECCAFIRVPLVFAERRQSAEPCGTQRTRGLPDADVGYYGHRPGTDTVSAVEKTDGKYPRILFFPGASHRIA
jgi:ankyrin repeat protein